MTQDKIMESVCVLEVTDCGTSGLGTTSLKCQVIRSAGLSVAALKEFYCIYKQFSYVMCVLHDSLTNASDQESFIFI
jgi:hypothetical protein